MFYVIFVGFVVGITTIQIHYNDQQMYPFDEGQVQKCKQCGIVYGMKLREMQWVEVVDEGEFVVSVWGENDDVHASGWGEAMHPSEGSNYWVKILLRSQCITHEKAEVSFEVLFRLWRKDASYEDIAVPARLLCVEEEQLNTIRQTLARIYSIIWVTALSLLPVFPIINLRLQVITFLWITCMTLFEMHLFLHSLGLITLLMMLIIYLRQQFWVEFPTSVVLEANLSANANITLLISYTCILVISLLLFSSDTMQMGPFESLCIHIRNWILLMIYGCLWCRLVWLNRFRHLFWYLILLWASLWLLPYYQHHHLGYFSLLLPQFYTTTCSYTNIGMSFMVLPIARYLQRCDKKYQILGTLALIGTVLLPAVHAFVGTVILVVSWILLECGRIGFQQMLQYRWLTLLSFQRLQ